MVSRRAMLGIAGGVAGAGAAGAFGYRAWRDREPASPPAQDGEGHMLWRNWSGVEQAYPSARLAPASEDELSSMLTSAQAPIRAVGAGHSFTGLATTDGSLLSLDQMKGLVSHDAASHRATIWAGTRLAEIGPALAAIGQEMPNLPDINKQSLAGGIATGTHGTGRTFKALHGQITKFRIALANGEIRECSATANADLFNAARVGARRIWDYHADRNAKRSFGARVEADLGRGYRRDDGAMAGVAKRASQYRVLCCAVHRLRRDHCVRRD